MGLYLEAKGYANSVELGYTGFEIYRQEIAKACGAGVLDLYLKWRKSCRSGGQKLNETELKMFSALFSEGFGVFLRTSECEGEMTPAQRRTLIKL